MTYKKNPKSLNGHKKQKQLLKKSKNFRSVHQYSELPHLMVYFNRNRTPTTRLKTLLLKLSEYTTDLKYQKGSEMYTSDALSRLHNLTDTLDSKDVSPLNFSQYLTPNYIEHSYSHWIDNLFVHKTKDYNMTQVKRKCGRLPKQKTKPDTSQTSATNTSTAQPKPTHKNPILRLFLGI